MAARKTKKAYASGVDPAVVEANRPLAKELVRAQKKHVRKLRPR
jgi:hypothetical protein